MTKAEFIKKFSKIEDTFEDEFRAEFNSHELIWEALKEQLLIHSVVVPKGTLCCPECKSTDLKVAIHTDYKECNKCYHYWAT